MDSRDFERARRRTNRQTALVFAIAAAGTVVLTGVTWYRGGGALALLISTIVLVSLGLGLLLTWFLRRRGVSMYQPQPILALDGAERRRVGRALRRGRPAPAEHREIAEKQIDNTLRMRWLVWVWFAVAALQAVNAVTQSTSARWGSLFTAVMLIAVGVVYLRHLRQLRRSRRAMRDEQGERPGEPSGA